MLSSPTRNIFLINAAYDVFKAHKDFQLFQNILPLIEDINAVVLEKWNRNAYFRPGKATLITSILAYYFVLDKGGRFNECKNSIQYLKLLLEHGADPVATARLNSRNVADILSMSVFHDNLGANGRAQIDEVKQIFASLFKKSTR